MKRWGWGCGVALLTIVALASAGSAPVVLKTTEFGRGPTVVLLHSVGSNSMVWMPTSKKLLATHHVVMVDLPGHGGSALPDPFSIDACAAALDQVLAKQNPDSTVLVAHRSAAVVAFTEVKAHPERVKGLIVIDAFTKSQVPIPEQQQQYFLAMLDEHYDEVLKSMTMIGARDSVQANELYSAAMAVPAASMKAYFKAALNLDVSGVLKTMRPAFLFVGSGQLLTPESDWNVVAKRLGYDDPAAIPHVRLANSGALIMKEQPDSLAIVIRDFTAQTLAAKKK